MAISIKTPEDIEKMRVAGRLAAEVLEMIEPYVKPGVSTGELDRICNDYIVNEQKAISACLGYHGYPKSVCISVNEVVCHGIPDDGKLLKDGDIVNIDVTVIKDDFHGDTSKMFIVGKPTILGERLCRITQESLYLALKMVKPGINLLIRPEDDDMDRGAAKIKLLKQAFEDVEGEIPWSTRKRYDEFDFGYALTVHKAQGSQWNNVVLFDESFAFRDTRERWLYTAITRAKSLLIIVGDEGAVAGVAPVLAKVVQAQAQFGIEVGHDLFEVQQKDDAVFKLDHADDRVVGNSGHVFVRRLHLFPADAVDAVDA